MSTKNLMDYMQHILPNADCSDYDYMLKEMVTLSRQSSTRLTRIYCEMATMLLYELYPGGSAMKMAERTSRLYYIPSIYPIKKAQGWSYNEIFFSLSPLYKPFEKKCKSLFPATIFAKALDAKHPLSRYFKNPSGIFELSEEYRIYTYRDPAGFLVLLTYIDEGDYIFTHNEYDYDPPKWVTPNRNFISPVWCLDKVHKALDNLIYHTGFTRAPIRHEILVTNPKGFVMNLTELLHRQQGKSHMTVYHAMELTTPIDCLSFKDLPMHHLWQYYYPLVHGIAFDGATDVIDALKASGAIDDDECGNYDDESYYDFDDESDYYVAPCPDSPF